MITVQGKQIETDASGYLLNIADWNEDVAKHIAQLEDVGTDRSSLGSDLFCA